MFNENNNSSFLCNCTYYLHLRVQGVDGFWKETVSQSVGPCLWASVAPTRWQQLKQLRTGMWTVLGNVVSSAEARGGVDVHQGGERTANDPLCCFDCPLKPRSVCLSAAHVPGGDTVRQQAPDGRAVEGQQQLSRLFLLRTLRKCRHCWACFMTAVVLCVQERSSEIWTPRNLNVWTLSTHLPLM